ncbi:lipid II:glycine glycyltransferase FemX [Benzoatithermus flavus]|uniref:Peptidoglycan bridge formation glycyltransferase FemA/FemB family protein n=1 Tax=Benzoatithermus flavus TaxID=3108223 RepID=A0ABU8XKL0_9PROT
MHSDIFSSSSSDNAVEGDLLHGCQDVDLSIMAADPEMWDRFVANAVGGDIVQTAAWARTKEGGGWQCYPVIAWGDGKILGGAQMLVRRLGPFATIAYIARGPLLVDPTSCTLAVQLLDALEHVANLQHVWHLIIQPPEGGDVIAQELKARGYTADAICVAPPATLRVDLTMDLDQILARMSSSRRRNVRQAETRGLNVRFVGHEAIATFHALHKATALRQGFRPVSRSYLKRQWEVLASRGLVFILMAYHKGLPLAAMWLTAFGDTITYRLAGWTGEGSSLQPGVACHWAAIKWGKERGYRWYDLGGIDRDLAALIAAELPLPLASSSSPAGFKLAFGGYPVLLPPAYQIGLRPAGRVMASILRSSCRRHPIVRTIIGSIRGR